MVSPYLIVFALLLIGYVLALSYPKYDSRIFVTSVFMLSVFLGLRCWQGTDYNMYRWLYNQAPSIFEMPSNYFSSEIHGEIGWKILMSILQTARIPFEVFIAVLSVFYCCCFYRFASMYSTDRQLSLLLAYPNLFLVYYASGLRQGFVIAVFIGFMLELLEKHQYKIYALLCLLLSTIHSSSLILLLAIIALRLRLRQILILLGGQH